MHTADRVLDPIGRLLAYPGADYADHLQRCRASLPLGDAEADSLLAGFTSQLQALPLERVQELYTQTFDLNPVCSLEVGWQLYGEEYARGSFLVAMREQLRRHCIPESSELPDHLTHVLSLLDRMEPEEARQFTKAFLIPAMDKMLAGFKKQNNPYRNLLLAIARLLSPDSGGGSAEAPHV
ncbi:MAG: nitrate reductase molybdenum cofactor assembly chaperone [Acidobacteria bacterium]|nr:nitrate reductase molybdenum cofactor assembly chaperone [Acidobacteriota bacterium]